LKLTLTNLSARHPAAKADAAAAIRDITIEIGQGEQVAVIGASGSGKTTLLHVIACAMQPTQGTLTFDETNPWAVGTSALQTLRGQLFLAPQVPPLPPRQRVVTAVLAGRLPQQGLLASVRSLFYPSDIPAAQIALGRFDISDKIFERVDRLSGGERQRVGLARALVSNASLFLVDEPLSALDPARTKQAIASLTSAASERKATLVCTLHQVDVALASFPRVIGLRDGVLAFDLPAREVTQAMLHTLYANKLEELTAAAPELIEIPAETQPAVMHCR
jgi:phosphonate transport system ATP-binding protein